MSSCARWTVGYGLCVDAPENERHLAQIQLAQACVHTVPHHIAFETVLVSTATAILDLAPHGLNLPTGGFQASVCVVDVDLLRLELGMLHSTSTENPNGL